ncbi:ABC transporter ATP-binding protein [uncultured Ruthenibacterium sp.]|uniref:ABC transporter ATP-binding protein n=1 Tax=uncultured Ruthenibacterium sp. TaxID=1905347 RepID=UPI00349E63E0
MAYALECEALNKHYGTRAALTNLTVHFQQGRIIGLLGPNGSGKTTLLKLAAGLLMPTGGAIRVYGQQPGVATKGMTAYLPDRLALPSYMYTRDVMAFYQDFFMDFDAEKAKSMLADLGIGAKDKIGAMSKGTREKLQLALTMSRAARLYLLDEPIGGVDPAARDYILNTIIRNYSEDATLILSTHLIGDIETILDDVVFLQNGQINLVQSVDSVREQYGKSVDAVFREVFRC